MWIFGLKGLTKFCVFYLYIIIIYDLITIMRYMYSKHELSTINVFFTPLKNCHITSFPGFSPIRHYGARERERDPGWVWSRGSRTKLILREESFVSQF